MSRPTVAVLRPDDNRIAEAVEYLQSLDVSPIPDPMLTIEPIDRVPQHADYCVFTSETGVELVATAGWEQRETTICAVGEQTATALRNQEGVIESVTHEDAGCWNCVYERQHPARGEFYRRVLQCNGDRDARVVRAS